MDYSNINEMVLENHTELFMNELLSQSPDIRAKIVVLPTEEGGEEIVIRDTDDLQTISINDSLYADTFVGTFLKTSAKIKMINYNGKYNLLNRKFNIYMGVYYINPEDEQETIEYENMGTYICYQTSDYKTEIELEIDAYNYSYLFEQKYTSNLVYPCTLVDYVNDICTTLGLELATQTFTNGNLILLQAPFLEEGATFRDAVAMASQAGGNYAKVKHNDKLYIQFFNPNKSYTIGDYSGLKQEELIGPYNVVVLGRTPQEDNIYYPNTLPDNPIEFRIDNNQIIDAIREVAIIPIYLLVNGFSFYPMEVEIAGNMLVQAGDYLNYLDLNDVPVSNPVFDHTLEYDGGLVSKYVTYQKSDTSTNYGYAGSLEKRQTNTELQVDKNSNEIRGLVEKTTQLGSDLTQLTQSLSGFEFKVQESGNMNLIENSVGWNDTKYWTLTGDGSVTIDQSSGLKDASTAKSGFNLNNITMKQEIQSKPNTLYAVCAVIKNTANLNAYVKITNGEETNYLFNINEIKDWSRYDFSFTSNSNRIIIEIYSASNNLTITDLVLAEGELIQSWYPAPNEIYTANVKIDRDGINISNSSSETRTIINASEFAIYSGAGKTISVNRDTTILQKAIAEAGFTIGRLRFDVKNDGVDATLLD